MHFSGPVRCEWIDGDGNCRTVRLLAPITFLDDHWRIWSAPSGLVSDGATIPRPLWSVIGGPFEGPYRRAAILHDAAYADQSRPRAMADLMLYEGMRCDGASRCLAVVMYLSVRAFGWFPWREDAKRKRNA